MRPILKRIAFLAVLGFGAVLALSAMSGGDPGGALILFGCSVIAGLGLTVVIGPSESRKSRGFDPHRKPKT